MKIFLTGATGYIGGSIARYLTDAGHEVRGLVRQSDKAKALQDIGISPVQGSLNDATLLAEEAKAADAVIHAANSDHLASVQTFLEALKGTGKAFIHTSGSSVVGDDARGAYERPDIFTDDTPFVPMDIRKDRVEINEIVRIAGVRDGIRTIVFCPTMIYGEPLGLPAKSDQLPKLYAQSRKVGAGAYIGTGLNRWSNVHIHDLAELYRLALEKAPSASYFYAENGEASFIEIATSISNALGFEGKTQSWAADDAIAELGNWARFAIGSNSRVRAVNARQLLGWTPQHTSIQKWIETTDVAW
ncbi:MAG: NAD-dependent epimerase/dehydratase family protein [Acetobacter fabarum]|jgi:nucleoside-diphosphate-sugar epimerase|nr:NAD-dependent epimerase/dehydratase family protein [Acetobacter fabarum]MCI1909574.1 NAD-dependent epimerase/dehydratase family protein [Acetobacter fabarum]MCI1928279.1 NAD-dependent epimerase/dehydratase family protein [Acetobacter fabarum]MCI1948094.1 NAD-dependent epimerase/dehydratase family protein [Acetobacter fabarum]MCI1989079.1 NAD-dependent epimerase/dehydratase family protein [Acetobacter fabarum]